MVLVLVSTNVPWRRMRQYNGPSGKQSRNMDLEIMTGILVPYKTERYKTAG
jgi:hypothetical protein